MATDVRRRAKNAYAKDLSGLNVKINQNDFLSSDDGRVHIATFDEPINFFHFQWVRTNPPYVGMSSALYNVRAYKRGTNILIYDYSAFQVAWSDQVIPNTYMGLVDPVDVYLVPVTPDPNPYWEGEWGMMFMRRNNANEDLIGSIT